MNGSRGPRGDQTVKQVITTQSATGNHGSLIKTPKQKRTVSE
jgi:hypothetical protein